MSEPITLDSVPVELQERRQWVLWRAEPQEDGKARKMPVSVSGTAGKSNDPKTWATFEEAVKAVGKFGTIGVGYVFDESDAYCGIDLDNGLQDGEWLPWAAEILDRFRGVAYGEISPSGQGCKLITIGKKPHGARSSKKWNDGEGVECYDRVRYWTMTGQVVEGFREIGQGQEAVDWLFGKYLARPEATAPTPRAAEPSANGTDLLTRAQGYVDTADPAPEGDRNNVAFRLAGHVAALEGEHGERLSDEQALDLLRLWNVKNKSPLPESELEQVARNSRTKGTPPPPKPPTGKRPGFSSGDNEQTLEGPTADRPPVFVTFDEAETARETIAGLGTGIYQRAGELVHIVEDALPCRSVNVPEGTLRIRPLAAPVLRERITERVDLLRATGKEPERVRPPGWLVAAIHQRGEWHPENIPPLAGIARSPTLRQDFSVLQTPGYDRPTGLFYSPDGEFPPVPDSPTLEDARRAAAELLETVCDFPFLEADGEDHRTAWLAYALTLVGRPAIAGPVPLFCFDAPAAGSGKSLLVDVANIIVFGDEAARYSWSGDDAELRKTITSVALEALPAVLLDNLDGDIRSAALDACLTGTTWRDRVLGKSETTGALPLTTVWAATGNNVGLQGDTSRRALFCRIEPDVDDPEARTDFRHDDLTGWTRDNRHRLAVAAVTILRAYAAAGRPQVKLSPWGSYESWSSLIRQAVVWLGFEDPAATRRLARAADRTREIHRQLLDGIQEADDGEGLTSAEIVKRAEDATIYPILAEAVAEICGPKPDSRRIGNRLKRYRGRRHEGRQLASTAGHAGATKWYVSTLSGDSGGSGDSTSNHSMLPMDHSVSPTDNVSCPRQEKVEGLGTESPDPPDPPMQRQRGVL